MGLVDSDKEEEAKEDGMIGNKKSTVSDKGDKSELVDNVMNNGDEMKNGNGAVKKKLDETNEDRIEYDDKADETFPGEISDQDFFTIFVEDVVTEKGSLRLTYADYDSDVDKIEDKSADSLQLDFANDNA